MRGKYILYRGIDKNGNRISRQEEFHPTMYVPYQKKTDWTTLDGYYVDAELYQYGFGIVQNDLSVWKFQSSARLYLTLSPRWYFATGRIWSGILGVLAWFFLPWLDKSPVRSGHYRPLFRKFFWFGLIPAMVILFICGGAPAEEPYVMLSQLATAYYFLHFLVILPIVSQIEKPAPLPYSITETVLGSDKKAVLGENATPAV
jgi:hypothetical protein